MKTYEPNERAQLCMPDHPDHGKLVTVEKETSRSPRDTWRMYAVRDDAGELYVVGDWELAKVNA